MRKLIIATALIIAFFTTHVFAQSGDLEVVSIDLASDISVNATSTLSLVVNQNGPGNLPTGSARINIGIDPTKITWVLPLTITDDCGNLWTVQTQNITPTTSQIQIRNNTVLANGAGCGINIPVQGVAQGTTSVTVTSSVFGAGVSDPNGTNQGATTSFLVGPLPVTLVSFTAQKEGKIALLKWATTEETNSDYFEIQHSKGGKEWYKIGTVSSHGESKSLKNYTFSDAAPVNGENLYRLKMVDKDQTFAYSRIQNVTFEGLTDTDLSVYPNPTVDVLRIRDYSQVTKVSIYDMNGRTVLESGVSNTGEISVRNLVSGIYLVRVNRSNGLTSSQKIVVGK